MNHCSRVSTLALAIALFAPSNAAHAFSGGPFTTVRQDRAGSPISNGACSACHGGGSFNASVTLSVFDGLNQPATTYTAGDMYTVSVRVSGAGAGAYGMQMVGLDASNAQAGSLSSPSSSATVTTSTAGIDYFEHSSPVVPGMGDVAVGFETTWTPGQATGIVTFYASGLAANFNGGTSGDEVATATLSLPAAPAAPDFDMDGTPDDADADDDNDGVADADDSAPQDPLLCRDLDGDTCDDCAVGVDGLGPEVDADPTSDGADADADGVCDLTDICQGDDASGDTDSDGVCDDVDLCEGDDSLGDEDNDGVCGVAVAMDMGADMPVEDMTPDASAEDETPDASVEDATPDASVEDATSDTSDTTPDQEPTPFTDEGDDIAPSSCGGCSNAAGPVDMSLVSFALLCMAGVFVRRRRR